MSDLEIHLRNLCSRDAEVMPDGVRLTDFVKVGNQAADTIQSLTAKLERAKEALYGVTLVKPIDHTDEHGTPLDLAQKVARQALKDIEND